MHPSSSRPIPRSDSAPVLLLQAERRGRRCELPVPGELQGDIALAEQPRSAGRAGADHSGDAGLVDTGVVRRGADARAHTGAGRRSLAGHGHVDAAMVERALGRLPRRGDASREGTGALGARAHFPALGGAHARTPTLIDHARHHPGLAGGRRRVTRRGRRTIVTRDALPGRADRRLGAQRGAKIQRALGTRRRGLLTTGERGANAVRLPVVQGASRVEPAFARIAALRAHRARAAPRTPTARRRSTGCARAAEAGRRADSARRASAGCAGATAVLVAPPPLIAPVPAPPLAPPTGAHRRRAWSKRTGTQ